MNQELEKKCYSDWRRREAYMVPVTQEGIEQAEERYKEFKKGWEYGLRYVVFMIEQEHKENKYIHKFYLLLSDKIRKLFKGERQCN